MSYAQSLQLLDDALDDLRHARIPMPAFCQTWRTQTTLLAALPPRYSEVMEDLLGRMEAAALFAEESCSFSPEDLHSSLEVWLEKARQTLKQG